MRVSNNSVEGAFIDSGVVVLSFEDEQSCPICAGKQGGISAPRHVSSWRDLTGTEQMLLLSQIGELLAARGECMLHASHKYGHFHVHAASPQMPACTPGAADRLITGGTDPLLPVLEHNIDGAQSVDLAIAFALESGVRLLEPWLRDLLERNGKLRMVVGDYMDVSEPAALWRLLDLEGARVYIFETKGGSFHPKAWLFRAANSHGSAIVGSSNLTATALKQGIEWNLHTENAADDVAAAFADLLQHPQVKQLEPQWIENYQNRRKSAPLSVFAATVTEVEPHEPPPEPHDIQKKALEALNKTRRAGHKAGLVVMATGLGKTWLAAFDSQPFARILFVAHREEILNQAIGSFRRIRPEARFGRYTGQEKDADAEILFASIQTLGRQPHLERFAADSFDYIIIDEFHHAAAASYGKLIDHFKPKFLSGLTATPDRTDGKDLLGLCGDNLVFHCDLFEGIEAGLLSPFNYMGVPDNVDYDQIPWRSSQFDPTALEAALATEARAANALEQFERHRNGPTIGFCCSKRHADFMSDYFKQHGYRSASVHSGKNSAPRATSLKELGEEKLDVLFAVDMFNEGVDVPNIGTVLMLRPTESTIIWLQQLGRGLRRVEGKVLQVIDYIGNHRSFLTKVRALACAGPGDQSLLRKLGEIEQGQMPLPAGCTVTYDLEVIDLLHELLRQRKGADEMEALYRDYHLRNGTRPRAQDMFEIGFSPAGSGHGGWFDFVRDMGDAVDAHAMVSHGDLLLLIEKDKTLDAAALGALQDALHERASSTQGMSSWASSPHVQIDNGKMALARPDPSGAAGKMLAELIDWRLADLGKEEELPTGLEEPGSSWNAGPQLWENYMREQIAPLFDTTFNTGKWQSGIIREGHNLILLVCGFRGKVATCSSAM